LVWLANQDTPITWVKFSKVLSAYGDFCAHLMLQQPAPDIWADSCILFGQICIDTCSYLLCQCICCHFDKNMIEAGIRWHLYIYTNTVCEHSNFHCDCTYWTTYVHYLLIVTWGYGLFVTNTTLFPLVQNVCKILASCKIQKLSFITFTVRNCIPFSTEVLRKFQAIPFLAKKDLQL